MIEITKYKDIIKKNATKILDDEESCLITSELKTEGGSFFFHIYVKYEKKEFEYEIYHSDDDNVGTDLIVVNQNSNPEQYDKILNLVNELKDYIKQSQDLRIGSLLEKLESLL